MDYTLLMTNGLKNRYPNNFVTNFASIPIQNTDLWVSFDFNCNKNYEHIGIIGNEYGDVTLLDTRFLSDNNVDRKFYNISGHPMPTNSIHIQRSAVMDLRFVPGHPHLVVTVSGDGDVVLLDLNSFQTVVYSSHTASAKAISFFHDESKYFVTGGRDGYIIVWDLRLADKEQQRRAGTTLKISDPHCIIQNSHSLRNSDRKQRVSTGSEAAGITSLVHLDEFYIASSSSVSTTGIRIWDIRYQKHETPLKILNIPQRALQKQTGISSLSLDRYNSQIFALSTDNRILVYEAQSNFNNPVQVLQTPSQNSYQIQIANSPISDHLLCGSSLDAAYIFDLQEIRNYKLDNCSLYEKSQTLPLPKYRLGEHKGEVGVVKWSNAGRYIATLDDNDLRIWDSYIDPSKSEIICNDQPLKFARPELLTYARNADFNKNLKPCRNVHFIHEHPLINQTFSPIRKITNQTFRTSQISTSPSKQIKSPIKKRVKLEGSSILDFTTPSRKNLSNVFITLGKDGSENINPNDLTPKSRETSVKEKASSSKSKKRSRNQELTPGKTPMSSSNKSILDYFSPKSSS